MLSVQGLGAPSLLAGLCLSIPLFFLLSVHTHFLKIAVGRMTSPNSILMALL